MNEIHTTEYAQEPVECPDHPKLGQLTVFIIHIFLVCRRWTACWSVSTVHSDVAKEAIQVLRNAIGGGGCVSAFLEKKTLRRCKVQR